MQDVAELDAIKARNKPVKSWTMYDVKGAAASALLSVDVLPFAPCAGCG